ncbi:hypothetical protein ABZX40_14325 [Streptomyces sp. NPDC004610]|uniref:hypothetical protein n=1 Tax=unclassified Streptomyces TaxID=2593676 RepID=UPI0033B6D5E2
MTDQLAPDDWAAPLPMAYDPLWARLTERVAAGRYPEAVAAADRLESALDEDFGPLHPYTVNALTVRAWLTLLSAARTHAWAETAAHLVETTQRRRAAEAPDEETHRTLRNAHAVWTLLTSRDPETARELAGLLLPLLAALPLEEERERCAGAVAPWVDAGTESPRSGSDHDRG